VKAISHNSVTAVGGTPRPQHWPVSPLAGETAFEHTCCDPKDGELYLAWSKPEETLVEDLVTVLTCKSLVVSGYRGERLIEPSSSWFPPKFPSG